MNIFGFRPFKGRFNLGNSDDIPTNTDGTLIGAVKEINNDLVASDNLKFRFASDGEGNHGYLGADDSFIPFNSGAEITTIKSASAQTFYMQTGSTPSNETIDIKNYRDDWAELVNSDFIVSESGDFVNTGPYASGVSYAGCGIARYSQYISYNATTGILTFTRPYYRCWAYNSQSGTNYVANNYAWPAYTLYCIK